MTRGDEIVILIPNTIERKGISLGKRIGIKSKGGKAMFARITSMNIKPERIEDAIAVYKKSVVPAAKSQKGFAAAYLLADRETGKMLSITFWKSEQDALENERNRYYQEQIVKFLDMLQSGPIREGYEVAFEG